MNILNGKHMHRKVGVGKEGRYTPSKTNWLAALRRGAFEKLYLRFNNIEDKASINDLPRNKGSFTRINTERLSLQSALRVFRSALPRTKY